MKKEIADKWVAALRSGEYKQTTKMLCKIEDGVKSYCCLGVLTDMGINSGVEIPTVIECKPNYKMVMYKSTNQHWTYGVLPDQISDWAGMRTNSGSGSYKLSNNYFSLWQINDAGYSFQQIADVIEKNWDIL